MTSYLVIAAGGALGSVLRYVFSGLIANAFGSTFPWGTLIVNISGSFVIGIFAALARPEGRFLMAPGLREFLMIGICGGYTTFSSFSLQTLELMQRRQWLQAGANSVFSLVLCLVAVWLGYILAAYFNTKGGG